MKIYNSVVHYGVSCLTGNKKKVMTRGLKTSCINKNSLTERRRGYLINSSVISSSLTLIHLHPQLVALASALTIVMKSPVDDKYMIGCFL